MMDLDFVPPHLLVVGGSYVGLEFAQMFRRFGSRVTVVEMGPRARGSRGRGRVRWRSRTSCAPKASTLRLDAECISVQKEAAGLSVGLSCEEGAPREHGTHLLLAVGRVPNTDDLGLDAAGITTDKRGYIEVDEGLRTSNPHVWALGDCNGKGAFTHTAYNDYEIVADNLLSNAGRKHTDRLPVYALYTDPPLGRVGMSEAEIRKAGMKALVGKRPMSRVARAVEKGETARLPQDPRRGGLEAHPGRRAARHRAPTSPSIRSSTPCTRELPYTEFQRHVRIHPTVSELLPTVLEDLTPL